MGAITHPLTVRLEPDLYRAASDLARKRKQSLNALVQDSLARALRQQEDQELYEAFERLGENPAACDVEYAFGAQSEVVLRERP